MEYFITSGGVIEWLPAGKNVKTLTGAKVVAMQTFSPSVGGYIAVGTKVHYPDGSYSIEAVSTKKGHGEWKDSQ